MAAVVAGYGTTGKRIIDTLIAADGQPLVIVDDMSSGQLRVLIHQGVDTKIVLGPRQAGHLREALAKWWGNPPSLAETAEELPAGEWRLTYETCDCGDGYPCGHPPYVSQFVIGDPGAGGHVYETGELPNVLLEYLIAVREETAGLLAEVRELRDAAPELRRDGNEGRPDGIG